MIPFKCQTVREQQPGAKWSQDNVKQTTKL